MKYIVTLGVFDHTVEANIGWHSAIFASKLNEETQQIELVDSWGFYGAPRSGARENWIATIVRHIGLNLNLDYNPGNHGWLKHEELRFMDRGHGLRGRSFELTETQFNQLLQECASRMADQEAAVREFGATITPSEKEEQPEKELQPEKKVRHYVGEEHSRYIFKQEQRKAEEEKRPSRLKPFDFDLAFSLSLPCPITLKASNTCKTQALSILSTVLPPEKLAPYYASTFPRLVTTGMEHIVLFSVGPLEVHRKANGKPILFRKMGTADTKVFWAIPPQIKPEDALTDSDTVDLLKVNEAYCKEAKKLAAQLIRVEWLLRKAKFPEQREVPEQYKVYQERLIQRVAESYKAFSVIPSQESKQETVSGWMRFFYDTMQFPKSPEQQDLQTKIKEAKFLLNSLYMATGGWTIYSERPPEPVSMQAASTEENPLEALVAYLDVTYQEELCKILGRTYCKPTIDTTLTPAISGG